MTLWNGSIDCHALVPRAVLDFLIARCCVGFPSRSALTLVWLRQYSLRASLLGPAPFSHRYPPARVKRRCAFRLRVRLQPLLASTRPWSLFTDIDILSRQLCYRDAIFFSSPQLAKKRRQIRRNDGARKRHCEERILASAPCA